MGSVDESLYRTRREFDRDEHRCGYSIPLPPGRYRLALHFCETGGAAGFNVFEVYAEDRLLFKDYDGFTMAGFGKADVRSFEVEVDDSMLERRGSQRRRLPAIGPLAGAPGSRHGRRGDSFSGFAFAGSGLSSPAGSAIRR